MRMTNNTPDFAKCKPPIFLVTPVGRLNWCLSEKGCTLSTPGRSRYQTLQSSSFGRKTQSAVLSVRLLSFPPQYPQALEERLYTLPAIPQGQTHASVVLLTAAHAFVGRSTAAFGRPSKYRSLRIGISGSLESINDSRMVFSTGCNRCSESGCAGLS